jgi:hypothetical protein
MLIISVTISIYVRHIPTVLIAVVIAAVIQPQQTKIHELQKNYIK